MGHYTRQARPSLIYQAIANNSHYHVIVTPLHTQAVITHCHGYQPQSWTITHITYYMPRTYYFRCHYAFIIILPLHTHVIGFSIRRPELYFLLHASAAIRWLPWLVRHIITFFHCHYTYYSYYRRLLHTCWPLLAIHGYMPEEPLLYYYCHIGHAIHGYAINTYMATCCCCHASMPLAAAVLP